MRQREPDARLQAQQVQHARGLGVAVDEHELELLERAAVAQLRGLRVALAQQHDVALLQDGLALGAGQRRQVAEGEVQPPVLERRRHRLERELHRVDAHPRRLAADGRHQRRQELVGADVAHVHDEAPLRARGVEAQAFAERGVELAQRGLDLARELVGARRRRDAAAAAHEERVAQRQPQPRQRVAHRRLAQAQRLRRAADAARGVHRREDVQQVEVELAYMHGADST
ncbi:MAG: hypothetical protein AMXMBFR78_27060 [Rubrivivax sp.]